MYYICHKINLNCGGSYVDCPDWEKNKKATINPINRKDNECFHYAMTVIKSRRNKKKSWKNNKNECWMFNIKIDGCINNSKNSFTTRVSEHILSYFSMSKILSFKSIENKHDVYR